MHKTAIATFSELETFKPTYYLWTTPATAALILPGAKLAVFIYLTAMSNLDHKYNKLHILNLNTQFDKHPA